MIYYAYFTVLCLSILLPSPVSAQAFFSNPESAMYDAIRDRYFITNVGNGQIIEIDSTGDTSLYYTASPWVLGMVIVGDTLFVTNNIRVLGFDLTNDQLVYNVTISGSSDLNDITADTSGNLYITGSSERRVYKLNINSQDNSIIASGMYWPNGILFDNVNNRLLMCSFGSNAPIRAISLDGSSVTVLINTPFTNLDGLTEDNDGNILISSWGNDCIYRYDRNFANPPELVSGGHIDPADIYYNKHRRELVVPNFNSHTVDFLPNPFSMFSRITEGPHVNDTGISTGMNWVDYDNDDDLDLFVPMLSGFNRLYCNNGDGSFFEVTAGDIVSDDSSTAGCWADYDNDGDLDAYVTNGMHENKENSYYRNNGAGSFTKITDDVIATTPGASMAAVSADYNNDGALDILTTSWLFSEPCPDHLYQGQGDGQFTRITEGSIVEDNLPSGNAIWSDYDSDGDQDLFVIKVGAGESDVIFRNDGDEFPAITGLEFLTLARNQGFSLEDYDNDGDQDLFIPTWEGYNSALFENDGDAIFTQVTDPPMTGDGLWSTGCCSGDFDNDGDLDIFLINDHNGEAKPDFFYINDGSGNFTSVVDSALLDISTDFSCKASTADYDRDGALDLYIVNWYADEANSLYRNKGNANNWFMCSLIGTNSNQSAIGAKVRALASIKGVPVWQMRELRSHPGPLEIHFGLSDAEIVDSLRVEWPSGMVDFLIDVGVNQYITIIETKCGDANSDQTINVGDAVFLISYVFRGGPAPDPLRAGDANCDEQVNVGDAVYLISYVFKGGPAPCCP
jgi:hypothetical protein